ncbi:MAG: PLP-dependent aminotransferase family protein [Rhodospirillales bacterium]|nr:PLP-dependent aminotransferase family protein [Rhodospirillales bacterium]
MPIQIPDPAHRNGPIYAAIADAFAGDIEQGRLKPGVQLPPHRQLAHDLGVTVGTIAHAYTDLARRGLVVASPGRGTIVRNLDSIADDPESGPGLIDLTTNRPATDMFGGELAETLGALSKRRDLSSLQDYRSDAGAESHREAGAIWVSRTAHLTVSAAQIVVCNGTQHALCASLMALTRAGDSVFTEALTYAGLKAIAAKLQIGLHGLPMDDQGLLPDAFEDACKAGKAKVLVCVPSLHNPTTVTMNEARRKAIARVAERYDIAIIEDDVHGPMLDDHPSPIAAFAPDRTILITGTSKAIAPGLRVGYIATPEGMTRQIIAGIRATTWMATPLMAEVASIWINDGTAWRIIDTQRQELAVRAARATRAFAGFGYECPPCSLHSWLKLPQPWRTEEFVDQARARGVAVIPAEAYAVGRLEMPHAVRINLGAARNRGELDRALQVLKDVLARRPEPLNPLA